MASFFVLFVADFFLIFFVATVREWHELRLAKFHQSDAALAGASIDTR